MSDIPAEHAEQTCTILLSGTNIPLLFKVFFTFAYIEKQMARDGATPTRFGPRPLNSDLAPSVLTMCFKQANIPAGLLSDEICTGTEPTPATGQ